MSIRLAESAFFETGHTIRANGVDYYAPPHIVAHVPTPTGNLYNAAVQHDLTPIVVVTTNTTLSVAGIEIVMDRFKVIDDVYQPGFGEGTHAKLSSRIHI
jgi:hypothetical protein